MTPAKAELLAALLAERFPDADALEAESRLPVPSRLDRDHARAVVAAELPERLRMEHAVSDTPSVMAARRAELRSMTCAPALVSVEVPLWLEEVA